MSTINPKDESIRLLELRPGKEETEVEYQCLDTSLRCAPRFDAIACMRLKEHQCSETSSGQQLMIPGSWEDTLRRLRLSNVSRYLWIEQLCIDHGSQEENARSTRSLLEIYRAAEKVIIWAGEDHEDDCFTYYLGRGSQTTTEHAFHFAHLLAAAPASDMVKLLQQKFSQTRVHSWAYLLRICYRPFFRGLPLLRTNYIEHLQFVAVQCSSFSVPWPTLKQAAQRLVVAHPTPHFLLQASTSNEDGISLLQADREYLLASLRFGLDLAKIGACNYWLFKKDSPHHERYLAHLGFCEDVYELKANGLVQRFTRHYRAIEESSIPGEEPVDEAMYANPKPLPALPFEGPEYPPPIPEEQAPFIHNCINRGTKLHLLVISPNSDLVAPLQCGLIEVKIAEYPKFAFVVNNSFLRRPLPKRHPLDPEFPVTTRSTSIILVNNQAFMIPRLQEVFLRLMRRPADEEQIFMWNLCMRPDEAGLNDREDVERYVMTKYFMEVKAKAETVDMYEVLDRAEADRTRAKLESLGLPKDMDWNEWMLELND
jgi:Heterokaryon incompatibility protein (HET)